MSNLIVKFLDKEYSIPEDVLMYLDLLKFTDSIKNVLMTAFNRKLSNSDIGCIEDNDMATEINQQVGKFISMLCDKGIYDRTVNDYLRNNKGYELFSQTNKAAFEKAKAILMNKLDTLKYGVEDALYKKDASVTGMGFSIWSGSFVNHAIYAAMQASTIRDQEKAANAQYQKDMDNLFAKMDSDEAKAKREYIYNVYIPNMDVALTMFAYELLDKYISDLIANNKFDKHALDFIDIARSNELLDNLTLSSNKSVILENAFTACPYNIAAYMQAMKYDLLDYESFQTAEIFKQSDAILSFFKENWGEVSYPSKFNIDYHCVNLWALFANTTPETILFTRTQQYVNGIIKAYERIAGMIFDKDVCCKALSECDENLILDGDAICTTKAHSYVDTIVSSSIWDQLVEKCGHQDLLDLIKKEVPSVVEMASKNDVDTYFLENLIDCFKEARADIVPQIKERREQERQRKIIEAEERTKAVEARKKKIKNAIIIGSIVTVVITLMIVAVNAIKAVRHNNEQLEIIESSYIDGGYEAALRAIETSKLKETQKVSLFNDLMNKTSFVSMNICGLKSNVPEHWEIRLSDDGDIASGNYPHNDEEGGLQWYIKYEGQYSEIQAKGDDYWTNDEDYQPIDIEHCTNSYVRYDSGRDNDGNRYMVIDHRVVCDSSAFEIQYFAYENRYSEKEAQFLLEQIDFAGYKYSEKIIDLSNS